jgi:hypothetical protein
LGPLPDISVIEKVMIMRHTHEDRSLKSHLRTSISQQLMTVTVLAFLLGLSFLLISIDKWNACLVLLKLHIYAF